MSALFAYVLSFVFACWPNMPARQQRDARATVAEVTQLPTSPWTMLRLVNIAALESGFRPDAVGPRGERGRWQVLGGTDFSAAEALRRLSLGMVSYVGCHREDERVVVHGAATTCAALIAHRVDRADLWFFGHEPPGSDVAAPVVDQVAER